MFWFDYRHFNRLLVMATLPLCLVRFAHNNLKNKTFYEPGREV